MQIADFLDHAVYENTLYLDFAEFAGIEANVTARIRRTIEDRQGALLETWLKSVRLGQGVA